MGGVSLRERRGDKGISIKIVQFEQWRRLTECKGEGEDKRDKGGSFLAGLGPMSVSFPITLMQRYVNPPSQPASSPQFFSHSLFPHSYLLFPLSSTILCTWTLAVVLPTSLCLLHPDYQGLAIKWALIHRTGIRMSSLTVFQSFFLKCALGLL